MLPSFGELLLLIAVFLALIGAVIRLGPRIALLAAVATLPFLQTPALKILARWRISEMLLWIIGAYVVATRWRQLWARLRSLPRRVIVSLAGLAVYVSYSGLVGLIRSANSEAMARSSATETYFVHPTLRSLLESGRALAALILVVLLVIYVRDGGEVRRFLAAFAAGGLVSAGYGWYQALVFDANGPLVPGTFEMGNARPASTFYEPTGFGSFQATVSVAAAGLIKQPIVGIMPWLLAAGFAAATAQLSISRAAIAGMAAGFFSAVALTLFKPKIKRVATTVAITACVGVLSMSGLAAAHFLIGSNAVRAVYSLPRVEQDVRDRVATDEFRRRAPDGQEDADQPYQGTATQPTSPTSMRDLSVASLTVGLGQGNAIFFVGGAPGVLRLLAEGGFVGLVGLLAFHGGVVWNAMHLFRNSRNGREPDKGVSVPLLTGAYVATGVISLNYISITDPWLWFFPGLLLAFNVPQDPGVHSAAG